MSPEKLQSKLKEYTIFDYPTGEWEGVLDLKIPVGNVCIYCCFTAIAPEAHKGQKFRLVARQVQGFRPAPTAPNLDNESEGSKFLLKTESGADGFGTWLDAAKVA